MTSSGVVVSNSLGVDCFFLCFEGVWGGGGKKGGLWPGGIARPTIWSSKGDCAVSGQFPPCLFCERGEKQKQYIPMLQLLVVKTGPCFLTAFLGLQVSSHPGIFRRTVRVGMRSFPSSKAWPIPAKSLPTKLRSIAPTILFWACPCCPLVSLGFAVGMHQQCPEEAGGAGRRPEAPGGARPEILDDRWWGSSPEAPGEFLVGVLLEGARRHPEIFLNFWKSVTTRDAGSSLILSH